MSQLQTSVNLEREIKKDIASYPRMILRKHTNNVNLANNFEEVNLTLTLS